MANTKLTWIKSTSPELSRSEVYRDDVLVATVYPNQVQQYIDNNAIAGVTYKYVIQSVDLHGESINEIVNSNLLNFYTGQIYDQLHPILFGWTVPIAQPNRIYFNSSKIITATNVEGFKISNSTVVGLHIEPGLTTGHYFEMSQTYDYWNNLIIRYEGGSNFQDLDGNPVFSFTQRFVINDFEEPADGVLRYGSPNGSGSHSGLDEANAWSYTEAGNNTVAGQTCMLLNGTSQSLFFIANTGNVNNLIKFIGYNNNGKDVNVTRTTGMSFDDTIMPLIENNSFSMEGTGIADGREYVVIKNIQCQPNNDAQDGFIFDYGTNILFDNCYVQEAKNGYFSFKNHQTIGIKLIRAYSANCANTGLSFPVTRGLLDELYICSSYQKNMDYYIGMVGTPFTNEETNTIVRNSYVDRYFDDNHPGHGLSIKGDEDNRYGNGITWSLFENVTINNVALAVEARHHDVRYNVYRNIKTTWGGVINNSYVGVQVTSARDNWFESCTFDCQYGIRWIASVEDLVALDAGSGNKFINCIWTNPLGSFQIAQYLTADSGGFNRVPNNNYLVNCVWDNPASWEFNQQGNSGENMWVVNGIINNVPDKFWPGSGIDFGWLFRYTDFFNSWAIEPGNGNIDEDPQFGADWMPGNLALRSGVFLEGVYYDGSTPPIERDPFVPTIGAREIIPT